MKRLVLALLAALLVASPALADDWPGLVGTYVWTAPTAGATPLVYDVQVSRNDQAWVPFTVVRVLELPFTARPDEMIRIQVRGCLGTLDAPTGCGPWSMPSAYKTFRQVVTGAPGRPLIYCPEPFTKVSRDPVTGEVTCAAP